jgi:hypothetical protein
MKASIFNKEQHPNLNIHQPTQWSKLAEGMKRLRNYIREETNKISTPFDVYTNKNDVIRTNEDEDWKKHQRKGTAKTVGSTTI